MHCEPTGASAQGILIKGGSDLENLILKVNVGEAEGLVEYAQYEEVFLLWHLKSTNIPYSLLYECATILSTDIEMLNVCIQKFKGHFAREIEVVCVCMPTERVHVCVLKQDLKT